MALIAVLWIVAALSLVVTGLVKTARDEIRQVSANRRALTSEALGLAAINQVLQQMQVQPTAVTGLTYVPTQFEGVAIQVQVVPLTGLINLNSAPAGLLVRLFTVAGGLAAGQAEALSNLVLAQRQARDGAGAPVGFDAPEDLLQLPGVDYELYARLAPLVVADRRTAGGVNPLAAPVGVLKVLAGGDEAIALQIDTARRTSGAGVDTSRLDGAWLDPTIGNRFWLIARVPQADGGWLLSLRGVDVAAGARDGLPWQTFMARRWFEPAPR